MVNKIGLYYDPRKKHPWICRWFGEYEPNIGKAKRYSKSFKLKRDAEAFQAEKFGSFKKGESRDKPDDVTLKEFCADWLKIRKPEFRPDTVTLYKNTIDRLKNYFGPGTPLRQITPRMASKFIAELERLDDKEGELSAWSRHRTLRNCQTLFNSAVDWGLVGKNPFAAVKRPKLVTLPWHYLTPVEYKQLLSKSSLRHKALYALVLCY